MSETTTIRNGRVVTPDGVLEDGTVVLTGDRISKVGPGEAVGEPSPGSTAVDADGKVVMPGLVDLHGDDIERHLFPRSGARVDVRTALTTADRANVLNGVTTKFHAVAFEDSPSDDRSLAVATEVGHAIADVEWTLGDNRLHARCELVEESIDAIERLVSDVSPGLVSVMHHAPGDGQFDEGEFERHYVEDRDCPPVHVERLAAERGDQSASTLVRRAKRVAAIAEDASVPLASHDDESAADVDRMAACGAAISEYPVTKAAARRASERDLVTAMGAPNLVRGGSLWDNLDARSAVDDGVVDVLCADYHPPSLLAAPFVATGEPLAARVARVTANPAAAVGLSDRGRLEPGARADVLVVDPDPVPTVERVFVEGTEVARFSHGERTATRRPERTTP